MNTPAQTRPNNAFEAESQARRILLRSYRHSCIALLAPVAKYWLAGVSPAAWR